MARLTNKDGINSYIPNASVIGLALHNEQDNKYLVDEKWKQAKLWQIGEGASFLENSGETTHGYTFSKDKSKELQKYVFEHYESLTSSNLVLLVTYMRSGSSWLGDITKQAKDSIYFFEPFQFIIEEGYFTTDHVCFYNNLCRHPQPNIENHHEILKQLLKTFACDIDSLDLRVLLNVMRHSKIICDENLLLKENHFLGMGGLIARQTALRLQARRSKLSVRKDYFYLTPECKRLVIEACINAKHRIIKTIRLSMDLVQKLMEILPSLKVIHLVRDPRAITNSRSQSSHMAMSNLTESHSRALCGQMLKDLKIQQKLREQYPQRIGLVVYEILAADPVQEAKRVYEFLRIKFDEDIQEWVYSSAHAFSDSGYYGTYRKNSYESSTHWRRDVSLNRTLVIQKYCADVLNFLGFVSFRTTEELINFNISARSSQLHNGTL